MSVQPLKLPEIKVPRVHENSFTKLPEIKTPETSDAVKSDLGSSSESPLREKERSSSSLSEREKERSSSSLRERERERERSVSSLSERDRERSSSSVGERERERERSSSSLSEREREKERSLSSLSERDRERSSSSLSERERERSTSSLGERERERSISSIDSPKKERSLSSLGERDKSSSSLFDSPKPSRKLKNEKRGSSLDNSPKSSRVAPLDPPRKRASSSSWLGNIIDAAPLSRMNSIESPKRAASQPTLPSTSTIFQSSPSTVATMLEGQAENSMQSVPALPTFSQKKPLKRGGISKSEMLEPIAFEPKNGTMEEKSASRPSSPLVQSQSQLQPAPPQEKNKGKTKKDKRLSKEISPQKLEAYKLSESVDNTSNLAPEKIVEVQASTKTELRAKSPQRLDAEPQESPFLRCMKNLTTRVFVGTWNMQGKMPPAGGTEECETTIQRALLSPPKQKWEDRLAATLGPEYTMLPTSTLGAVHLAVFVHVSLIPLISEIRIGSIPTGLGNVVANKGGVAVTFLIGATSVAFVAAHFTAHHNKIEQRNADFHRINTMLNLSSPYSPPSLPAASSSTSPGLPPLAPTPNKRYSTIETSDQNAQEQSSETTDQKNENGDVEKGSGRTKSLQEISPQKKTPEKAKSAQELTPEKTPQKTLKSTQEITPEKKNADNSTQEDLQEASPLKTPEKSSLDMSQGMPYNASDSQEVSRPSTPLQEEYSISTSDKIPVESTQGTPTLTRRNSDPAMRSTSRSRRNSQSRRNSLLLRNPGPPSLSLYERFDRLFWFGDLNYRINGNKKIVEETVKQNLIEVLVANDQLMIEKKKGNVFQGFLEGPLHFPPTYKYDPGTDNFDTSAKARVPSWTDRILFKMTEHVTLDEYASCTELKYTDHRPVFASFSVGFSPPDPEVPQAGANGKGGSKVCTIL